MTSTYAAPAAPPPPPSPTTKDPTNVMGRRFLAWFIDLALFLAVVGGLAAALWEHKEVEQGFTDGEEYCEALLSQSDFDGDCFSYNEDVPVLGDYVFLVETSDQAAQSVVPLAWGVLNFVILQGLTGGSLGKLISGVRVVNAQGKRAGVGRSTGRTVLWIVDGAPWIFPLVGLITALTSSGHRRVGDMVMSTYVVGRKHVGTPITVTSAAPPTGQTSWGAVSPTAPPPEAQWPATEPQPWAPPPQPWDAPEPSGPAQPTPAPTQVPEVEPEPPTPEPPQTAEPWTSADPGMPPDPMSPSGVPGAVLPETPTRPATPDDTDAPGWVGAERDPAEPASPGDALGEPTWVEAEPTEREPADSSVERSGSDQLGGERSESAAGTDDVTHHDAPEAGALEEPAPTVVTPGPESPSEGSDRTAVYPTEEQQPPTPEAESESSSQAAHTAPLAEETSQPLPPPEWDAARNTYIQWDPNRQAWLQWDNNTSQWTPIDT